MRTTTTPVLATATLLAVGTAGSVGLGSIASRMLVSRDPSDPASLLLAGTAVAGSACAAWLVLGILLALAAHLPGAVGRRCAAARDRVTPALVRRCVALAVTAGSTSVLVPGTAVAATTTQTSPSPGVPAPGATGSQVPDPSFGTRPPAPSPAWSPSPAPSPAWSPSPPSVTASSPPVSSPPVSSPAVPSATVPSARTDDAPAPGWTPDRPRPVRQAQLDVLGGRPARPVDDEGVTVTVRRGECLWDIAARQLGPGASHAEIAQDVARWHDANRAVVGEDPDHIEPGMQLRTPRRW